MKKDSAYLLSYVKYGDNDAILHCFTCEMGFQSYFVRGIYSARNKKKAYLFPLNEITFTINDYGKSGITNIGKIEQVKSLDCQTDVRSSAIVFFIAEFLYQVLKKETKQNVVYQSIRDFLFQLESKNYQAHFPFMIEFLKIQGVAPLLGQGEFLDPEAGCFEVNSCHHLFNKEISAKWKHFVSEEMIYNVKLKNILKEDFLDSILLYYYCHFPDFKTPKSLEILREIFTE